MLLSVRSSVAMILSMASLTWRTPSSSLRSFWSGSTSSEGCSRRVGVFGVRGVLGRAASCEGDAQMSESESSMVSRVMLGDALPGGMGKTIERRINEINLELLFSEPICCLCNVVQP